MKEHIVTFEGPAMPLEKYLTRAYPMIPSHVLRQALKKRDVRVNGKRSPGDTPVRRGDALQIYLPDEYFSQALKILFEDDDIIAVEKPVGLPVDRDGAGLGEDTALMRLQAHCPAARLCHRLDTGTGGVLIAAKTPEAEAAVLLQMERHEIDKRYQCIVVGRPSRDDCVLEAWLIKDAAGALVRVTDRPGPDAKPIRTGLKVLSSRDGLTLLEIRLLTGRTHQIRAHMSHIGCPVLGDDKYGDRQANRAFHVSWPQLWCRSMTVNNHKIVSEPRFAGKWFTAQPMG